MKQRGSIKYAVVMSVLTIVFAAVPSMAAAEETWTEENIGETLEQPELRGTYEARGIFCAGSLNCDLAANGGGNSFVAAYDGLWSPEGTPNPAEGEATSLEGIDCAGECMATGSYVKKGKTARWALATKVFSGKSQAPPNPAEATASDLSGVSCSAPTACTAVGHYTISGPSPTQGLIERWNGKEWTRQTAATPEGAKQTSLSAVKCTSAEACTAVGYKVVKVSGQQLPLIEHWNGTAWSVQTSPLPEGAQVGPLRGIACTSAAACTAVGYYSNKPSLSGEETRPLVEHWNGTTWALQTGARPTGAFDVFLTSVSCLTGESCVAAGYWHALSGAKNAALVEGRTGTTWAVESSSETLSTLYSISCYVTKCLTVGSTEKGGFKRMFALKGS